MPYDSNGNYITDDEAREQEEQQSSGGSSNTGEREYDSSGNVIKNYMTPDEAREAGVEWQGRPNEPLPYRTEDEIAGRSSPYDYRTGYDDDPNRTWTPEAQWYQQYGNYDYSPSNGNPSASGGSGDGLDGWLGSGTGGYNGDNMQSYQFPAWYQQLIQQAMNRQNEEYARVRGRADDLYGTLLDRSQQGLAIDRTDPIIRAQADAYGANVDRSSRDYLGDLAESAGPYANLRSEERMQAESTGQAKGSFEAELMGRELVARREEIQNALSQMGNMLSADQARQLQMQLSLLDQAIAEAGIGVAQRGQDIDWQRALLGNNQFMSQLGLQAEDQYNYWNDPLRTSAVR